MVFPLFIDHSIYYFCYFIVCYIFFVLGLHAGECRAFVVDGQQVGLVRPDVVKEILNHPQVSVCL